MKKSTLAYIFPTSTSAKLLCLAIFISFGFASAQNIEVQVNLGHSSWINAMVFSKDGKNVISGSHDKTVKVWDLENKTVTRTFPEFKGMVGDFLLSKDSKYLFAGGYSWGGEDFPIVKVDFETGETVQTFFLDEKNPKYSTFGLFMDESEQYIGAMCGENFVRVWEIKTGKLLYSHCFDNKNVLSGSSLGFILGDKLICVNQDKKLRVHNFKTNKIEQTLEGPGSEVGGLALIPKKNLFYYSGATRSVNDLSVKQDLSDNIGFMVSRAVVSQDNTQLALMGQTGEVLFFNWNDAAGEYQKGSSEQLSERYISDAVFTSDGKNLLVTGENNTMRSWNIAERKFDFTMGDKNPAKSVDYARFYDNKTIAYGAPDGSIAFLDLSTLNNIKPIEGLKGSPDAFGFSNNRKYLIATSFENETVCWDIKTGKKKYSLGTYDSEYVTGKQMCFSPDDSTFAATDNCNVLVRNLKTGNKNKIVKTIKDECINAIAYSGGGDKLYCGGNYALWIYDLKKENVGATADIKKISIAKDIDISADGKLIAVCGREGMVVLNPDLTEKFDLKGHTDWINDIAFSKDGKKLYSCSGTLFGKDRSVRIWNMATGKCEKVMTGHTGDVNSIDESPDGRFILSTSNDCSIKVWSTVTQTLVCTLIPVVVKDKVSMFCYTPSGIFYGPDEFFNCISVKENGKAVNVAKFKTKDAKANLLKVLK